MSCWNFCPTAWRPLLQPSPFKLGSHVTWQSKQILYYDFRSIHMAYDFNGIIRQRRNLNILRVWFRFLKFTQTFVRNNVRASLFAFGYFVRGIGGASSRNHKLNFSFRHPIREHFGSAIRLPDRTNLIELWRISSPAIVISNSDRSVEHIWILMLKN